MKQFCFTSKERSLLAKAVEAHNNGSISSNGKSLRDGFLSMVKSSIRQRYSGKVSVSNLNKIMNIADETFSDYITSKEPGTVML